MDKASNARKHSALSLAMAAQIRAEMGAARMTVRTLAQKSGIPERTLSRLVSGERTIDVAQLDMICKALTLPMIDLFMRAEERLRREAEGEERPARHA
jgi:transcriptional regulator with XRE-family HTH domain